MTAASHLISTAWLIRLFNVEPPVPERSSRGPQDASPAYSIYVGVSSSAGCSSAHYTAHSNPVPPWCVVVRILTCRLSLACDARSASPSEREPRRGRTSPEGNRLRNASHRPRSGRLQHAGTSHLTAVRESVALCLDFNQCQVIRRCGCGCARARAGMCAFASVSARE